MNYQGHGNLSLHILRNASKSANAFPVFLRSKTEYSVSCQFDQTKNRVVPTKLISIPWLKLIACCIEAKLTETMTNDLHLLNIPKYFWTDFANALCWAKGSENWASFVLKVFYGAKSPLEDEDWSYVPWSLNAGDLLSPGSRADTFKKGVGGSPKV